ncbi:T9SS type A sorting domain-containing protein [Chryseobacterium sp. G0201]|uniref:T9SS type A sorting domain-containing protein n=1 Tax=Chryseobacterium sp. G0201 TaxID=2487065 RepID=UPI000F4E68C3|nr:T9SS type A sorting domain-containing protein [Chryseobacterium sp. G0201]AZA52399.1 T9SS C-terminal target domain-containing protein [Chryseobacterium sp. G0201]
MDRNLGALQNLPSYFARSTSAIELQTKTQIQQSGGLHYQWGRKDPLPTFHNPGGAQNTTGGTVTVAGGYNVFRQTGVDASGNAIYNVASPVTDAVFSSTDPVNGYSREWNAYKTSAGILGTEPKHEKIRKVIKYATENPLSFLFRSKTGKEIPSELINPNDSTKTLKLASAQVKDWMSDESGQMQDRWGHATEKSPYDPCPEGWRIPDMSFATIFGAGPTSSYAKGSSPWFYNGYNTTSAFAGYGIPQFEVTDLVGGYVGTNNAVNVKKYPGFTLTTNAESGGASSRSGWVFNFGGSKYNIGNIPTTGIRGILGGNDWKNLKFTGDTTTDNYRYQTGLWTSSPSDYYSGYAIGLNLSSISSLNNAGKLLSGTGFYPQAAMSCRCAKVEIDKVTKKEIGRYDPNTEPMTVPQNTTAKASNVFAKKQIEEIQKNNKKLTVFPNPVKSILYINADDKDYYYQIYNASGQLVKQGKFENRQTNVSSLTQGAYLVRINNSETVVKIIKE